MGRAGPRKVHCDSLEFKRQAVKLIDLDGVEVQAVHFFRRFLAEVQKYPSLVSREHYMSLYLGREPWLIPGTRVESSGRYGRGDKG